MPITSFVSPSPVFAPGLKVAGPLIIPAHAVAAPVIGSIKLNPPPPSSGVAVISGGGVGMEMVGYVTGGRITVGHGVGVFSAGMVGNEPGVKVG